MYFTLIMTCFSLNAQTVVVTRRPSRGRALNRAHAAQVGTLQCREGQADIPVGHLAYPNPACTTLERLIMSAGRNLAGANACSVSGAGMAGGLKKSIAHGIVEIANGNGNRMACVVGVIGTFPYTAFRNSGHIDDPQHVSLLLMLWKANGANHEIA